MMGVLDVHLLNPKERETVLKPSDLVKWLQYISKSNHTNDEYTFTNASHNLYTNKLTIVGTFSINWGKVLGSG